MKKWWRTVPKDVDDDGPVSGGAPAEPDRLWPIIDVLEAEKSRSED